MLYLPYSDVNEIFLILLCISFFLFLDTCLFCFAWQNYFSHAHTVHSGIFILFFNVYVEHLGAEFDRIVVEFMHYANISMVIYQRCNIVDRQ
jgi:hypothetical protein